MATSKPGRKRDRDPTDHALTESEWLIIKAVWDNEPCAAPTIQEALQEQTGWTYSTVKTLMDRMTQKGLLSAERVRNLVLYRSNVTAAQARKGEVMRALKRAFDGALTPMMQFLVDNAQMSEQQLDELEALIRQRRRQDRRGRKRG